MTIPNPQRAGIATAIGTVLLLVWTMGAVGIIGVEGDRADLMYLGVIAVAIAGAIVARLRPCGMARAMAVTAGATVLVGVIALLLGKHQAEYSSVLEIVGLTGMFATPFGVSAWLFGRAAAQRGAD